jgi:hypothetical protein
MHRRARRVAWVRSWRAEPTRAPACTAAITISTPSSTSIPLARSQTSAPTTVHTAVEGITQACVPQPDQMLYDPPAGAIGECATWAGQAAGQGTRRDTAPSVLGCESRNAPAAH